MCVLAGCPQQARQMATGLKMHPCGFRMNGGGVGGWGVLPVYFNPFWECIKTCCRGHQQRWAGGEFCSHDARDAEPRLALAGSSRLSCPAKPQSGTDSVP